MEMKLLHVPQINLLGLRSGNEFLALTTAIVAFSAWVCFSSFSMAQSPSDVKSAF